MAITAFEHSHYKQALAAFAKKDRGGLSRMAEAANCQVSYLSRVLRTKIQLTPDQAFRIAEHLKFDSEETDYFLLLVDIDRAGDPRYRERLKTRADAIRKERLEIKNQVRKQAAPSDQMDLWYHSHWGHLTIHTLLNTDKYNTVAALQKRTQLPAEFIRHTLEALLEKNLILKSGETYKYNSSASHIPRNSPILPIFHSNWRQRAVTDSYLQDPDTLHFTNVQSISEKDFKKLQIMLLDFIKEASRTATNSGSEDLFVLTCDLFRP